MPRIRCHYPDCIFLDEGYCGAAAVELDPDVGCMTFSRSEDTPAEDDDMEEWEEVELDDEDEELWLDEDEY